MPDQFIRPDRANLERIRLQHSGTLLFYLSLFIFLIVLSAFGGLIFLNNAQEQAREEILSQIDQKRAELRPELVEQIFSLESKLNMLRGIISQHPLPSRIIRWIEEKTYPQVTFGSFSFARIERRVDLPGKAASLSILNQQINLFQRDPDIESVKFDGLAFEQGGVVGFRTSIIFKPSFFQVGQ